MQIRILRVQIYSFRKIWHKVKFSKTKTLNQVGACLQNIAVSLTVYLLLPLKSVRIGTWSLSFRHRGTFQMLDKVTKLNFRLNQIFWHNQTTTHNLTTLHLHRQRTILVSGVCLKTFRTQLLSRLLMASSRLILPNRLKPLRRSHIKMTWTCNQTSIPSISNLVNNHHHLKCPKIKNINQHLS